MFNAVSVLFLRGVAALSRSTIGVVIVASVCVVSVASASAATPRPNVLLVVADDLGYSDIGAFGSEIKTPNLDELARGGRILTNFHTAAACAPTRATLMSGSDHHLVGLGTMIPPDAGQAGKPGYEGYLTDNVATLPQVLRDGGYHTYMTGKWHLGLDPAHTPSQKGFELSFALLEGGGSHFAPVPGKPQITDKFHWVENGAAAVLPPDFYSSNYLTDKMIAYINQFHGDDKPFFAYLSFTAPHWPLHAPADFIDRYAGRYDVGYDVIRDQRIARQKALGIIPADFKVSPLTPSTANAPRWNELDAAGKKREARKMEVYAAMVENLDWNVGRLLEQLKKNHEYDNTVIVFISDNGAEGGPSLVPNTPVNDNSDANLGKPLSNFAYGRRWAEVGSTPLALWKAFSAEGGIAVPAIVKLPHQTSPLPISNTYLHVADLYPTLLQFANVAVPQRVAGTPPLAGKSAAAALSDVAQKPVHANSEVQVDELFGRKYVRRGQWKLVWNEAPWSAGQWQLFDIEKDRGETLDLAARHPKVVRELADEFDNYVKSAHVIMPQQPGLGMFQEAF